MKYRCKWRLGEKRNFDGGMMRKGSRSFGVEWRGKKIEILTAKSLRKKVVVMTVAW